MKNIYKFVLIALAFNILGCSDDDGQSKATAMEARINGAKFRANSPSNDNLFSPENLFDRFPMEDYVLLQARTQSLWKPEINLWLKRDQIAVGTYPVGPETFTTPPSHFVDLIENSNDFEEHTKNGTVVITSVDTTEKIVEGTFEFTTVQDVNNPVSAIDFTVTNGKFKYKFE